MHLFEFLLFLIVSRFGFVSSGVALLESSRALVVTQFEFCLFLILRYELRRNLVTQAVPAR